MSYLSAETCKQAFSQLAGQRISGKFIGILFILKNISYQTILSTALGNLKYASYNKSLLKDDLKSYFSLNSNVDPIVGNPEFESCIFISDFKNWVLQNLLRGQRISALSFAIFIFRNTSFEQPITKHELEAKLKNLLNISDDFYQAWFQDSNSEDVLDVENAAFRWENFEHNGIIYRFEHGHKSIVFAANAGAPYSTDAAPEELTRGPFYQPIYASHNNPIQFIPQDFFLRNQELTDNQNLFFNHSQIIYFGAPGTGKSNKIEKNIFVDANGVPLNIGLSSVDEGYKFRTTFHPDYDYAQFVGAYKPRAFQVVSQHEDDAAEGAQNMANQNKTEITYEFTPQVFAKAYVTAWLEHLKVTNRNPDAMGERVYLVIEEINRGNCAQIFGDIFQLLDRKNGHSAYSIDVDADFAEYIRKQLLKAENDDENEIVPDCWNRYKAKIQEWSRANNGEQIVVADEDEFCKAALPPNLIILATMNTSDQSLFPMDSAFKRRFDWEYVPIKDERDETCGAEWNADQFVISVGNSRYNWLDFLKGANKNILYVTRSEDKQMGEFFIKPKNENNIITLEEFRSKVLFYLWDSVYKDEMDNSEAKIFKFKKTENGQEVDIEYSFQDLYKGLKTDQENRVKNIVENAINLAR